MMFWKAQHKCTVDLHSRPHVAPAEQGSRCTVYPNTRFSYSVPDSDPRIIASLIRLVRHFRVEVLGSFPMLHAHDNMMGRRCFIPACTNKICSLTPAVFSVTAFPMCYITQLPILILTHTQSLYNDITIFIPNGCTLLSVNLFTQEK